MENNVEYEVRSLDVWGNAEEGYDVNDSFSIGTIELSESMSDKEILQALVKEGYLDDRAMELGEVDQASDEFIHIYVKSDMKPVLNLFAVQE
jgi:hypothetical protein